MPGAGGGARDHDHAPGNIGVLENTRFHAGEEKNDPELAKAMAALGDYYVDDSFSDRAPRTCLDRRDHPFSAELCRGGRWKPS